MALTSIPRGPHERSRMMREVEGLCLERVRAEPFDRHKQSETGQDKIDRKHLQLAAPQVGGAGAEHQHHHAGRGERREHRRDVKGGGHDEAHRRQQLEGADALDLPLCEVLDPAMLSEASSAAFDWASFITLAIANTAAKTPWAIQITVSIALDTS